MKNIKYIFLLLIIHQGIYAIDVTPDTKISILTNSPGNELYTLFGHNAIRVYDSTQNIDYVFNYGTFNFSTPNFYIKFVKGKLDYLLSVQSFESYLWGIDPNQSAYEQELNLTIEQRQKLIQFLENNYLPENRSYKYDFLFDNCATRIKDALLEVFKDDINFSYFQPKEELTFREILNIYTTNYPWIDFGADIITGASTDMTIKPIEYSFIPEFLMEIIAVSLIQNNGKSISLVSNTKVLAEGETEKASLKFVSPIVFFWLIFLIIFTTTIANINSDKIKYWIDYITFGILGFLGLFLFIVSISTEHEALQFNLNLLWAFPLHLIIIFFIKNSKTLQITKYYFLANLILCIGLLISWELNVQQYHAAIFPIILTSGIRSFRIFKQKIKK